VWGNQTSGPAIVQNKNVEQFADLVVLIYEVISLFFSPVEHGGYSYPPFFFTKYLLGNKRCLLPAQHIWSKGIPCAPQQ
jgi:hypothetical protein